MTEKKSNEPELIEDSELDAASGGSGTDTLRASTTEDAKPVATYSLQAAWPSKIEIGSLKAGDGSV